MKPRARCGKGREGTLDTFHLNTTEGGARQLSSIENPRLPLENWNVFLLIHSPQSSVTYMCRWPVYGNIVIPSCPHRTHINTPVAAWNRGQKRTHINFSPLHSHDKA
jgi:hypothetical protein